ncbi:hypothetical protein A2U01_0078166, partial [Trifolium medium]|nr:hypothetical protein [Trifolium medium]
MGDGSDCEAGAVSIKGSSERVFSESESPIVYTVLSKIGFLPVPMPDKIRADFLTFVLSTDLVRLGLAKTGGVKATLGTM